MGNDSSVTERKNQQKQEAGLEARCNEVITSKILYKLYQLRVQEFFTYRTLSRKFLK